MNSSLLSVDKQLQHLPVLHPEIEHKAEFVNRQHFPALCFNPVDVSGAGDSLLAALSVGLCSGAKLMQSSAIGAGMASLAVQQVGNIPVSHQQLKNYINQI